MAWAVSLCSGIINGSYTTLDSVLLFAKLNEMFFGYFDPDFFIDNENK